MQVKVKKQNFSRVTLETNHDIQKDYQQLKNIIWKANMGNTKGLYPEIQSWDLKS